MRMPAGAVRPHTAPRHHQHPLREGREVGLEVVIALVVAVGLEPVPVRHHAERQGVQGDHAEARVELP